MFQFETGDEHKVIFANHLTAVAHNTSYARCMFHEIQFKHLVVVNGVGKLLFVAVGNIQHVLVHERSNLMEYMIGGSSRFHISTFNLQHSIFKFSL